MAELCRHSVCPPPTRKTSNIELFLKKIGLHEGIAKDLKIDYTGTRRVRLAFSRAKPSRNRRQSIDTRSIIEWWERKRQVTTHREINGTLSTPSCTVIDPWEQWNFARKASGEILRRRTDHKRAATAHCTNSARARAGAIGRRSLARRITPCFFCATTNGCFIGGAIRHCTCGAVEL